MRTGAGDMSLRPAGPGDRELLFSWANDVATRAASFHPGHIDRATHDAWFARRLTAEHERIWIGEIDGRSIGQVRVERIEEGRAEVSISVASADRGRGLARSLLLACIAAAERELGVTTFVAAVRPDNAPSLALFRAANFSEESQAEHDGIACLILVRREEPLGR